MRPHALHPGAIQGKEGIKFCHLVTLLPIKRAETDSSSESDDGSEDSSSDAEENGAEYEMDSKDLCVEIKAKEKDKVYGSINRVLLI